MKKKKTTTVIYTARVADYLVSMGEQFLYEREDFKNKSKNVYVFRYSNTIDENLANAMNEVR